MNTNTTRRVHSCGNCQAYTAVVDGWAMDFAPDGFTATDVRHRCGESDRLHA